MRSDLNTYLQDRYTNSTVKIYLLDIRIFLGYMGEGQAKGAVYHDILLYVDYLRKHYDNPATINRMLCGVKAWYHWLLYQGIREDHPCVYLTLKDVKHEGIQLQDLFTHEELERLMDREERFERVRIRNKVVVSLLIYQGLRLKEVEQLKVSDVDLEGATIYTQGMARTLPRALKMQSSQIMLFYKYIHEIRRNLIKEETDLLLINMRGKPYQSDAINYFIETFKPLFPDRKLNARTIRQSVIANLLKSGKDLRVVQVFAGHKKASTTEGYRQSGLDELKAALMKHHPLS